MNRVAPRFAPYLLYFFSGFAALSYQLVWAKILSQTIGLDSVSTALSIAVLLLGLGIGGIAGSFAADAVRAPLYWFLGLELFTAVYGVATNQVLRGVAAKLPASLPLEIFSAGLVLLPATLAMGTALPLLAKVCTTARWSEAVGRLQAASVLGGGLGVAVTGFFILGSYGIGKTLLAIGAIQFGIAFCSALFFRVSLLPKVSKAAGRASVPAYWLLAAGALGFLTIGYQLFYLRVLGFFLSSTSYVLPTVLSSYLVNLSLGMALALFLLSRWELQRAYEFLGVGFFLTSSLVFLAPYILSWLDIPLFQIAVYPSASAYSLARAFIFSLLLLTPVVFLSAFFPLLVDGALGKKTGHSWALGPVLLAQSAGNAIACLTLTLVLLPWIGTVKTFLFLQLGVLVVWFSLWKRTGANKSPRVILAVILSASSSLVHANPSFFKLFSPRGRPVVRVHEDLGGTLFVDESENEYAFHYRLGAERVTEQRRYDRSRRFFPLDVALALSAKTQLQNILVIGFGPGDYPIFLRVLYPQARIDVVELLPSVLEETRKYGTELARNTLSTLNISIMDGRRFLNARSHPVRYDLIQIGTLLATASGAGNLYTTQALNRVRELLAPEGVAVVNGFAPVVRTALHVFPSVAVTFSSESDGIPINVVLSEAPFQATSFLKTLKKNEQKFQKVGDLNALRFVPPKGSFVILDRAEIERRLQGIAPQDDDCTVTEYFLNQPVQEREPWRTSSAVVSLDPLGFAPPAKRQTPPARSSQLLLDFD
jgi:spermidine synthase